MHKSFIPKFWTIVAGIYALTAFWSFISGDPFANDLYFAFFALAVSDILEALSS